MQILTKIQTLQRLAKECGKYAMYISLSHSTINYVPWHENFNPVPFLRPDGHEQIFCDGCAFLLFDSEDEMDKYFDQVVGDDGPTESNNYDGPHRGFAVTCDPEGTLLNENT